MVRALLREMTPSEEEERERVGQGRMGGETAVLMETQVEVAFREEVEESTSLAQRQKNKFGILVALDQAELDLIKVKYSKLPSQTIINPRENVSAITLRSGKEVQKLNSGHNEKEVEDAKSNDGEPFKVTSKPPMCNLSYPVHAPFPSRLAKPTKEEQDKEILDVFKKVEVNIPLIEAIKQIPRYAKFLKNLCTNKRKLRGNEVVSVGENVSAVIQRKLPPKCEDPGMFTIPCVIGKKKFEHAMLDLGASINVMPYSIYASLKLGPLKETGVIIQLADRSNAYPEGLVEDVLVQVNGLIFPADFYIVNMEDNASSNPAPILLGRSFLKTAKAKIDVDEGTLTMEFDGEIAQFSVFEIISQPEEVNITRSVNFVNLSSQGVLQLCNDKKNEKQKGQRKKWKEIYQKRDGDANVSKEKTRAFQDKLVESNKFVIGQKVLLFDSKQDQIFGKWCSPWCDPFVITDIFSCGIIEIRSMTTNRVLTADQRHLLPICDGLQEHQIEKAHHIHPG